MFKNTLGKIFDSANNKRIIEYLGIFAVIGVLIVIMANSLLGGSTKSESKSNIIVSSSKAEAVSSTDPNSNLEKKIAQILSQLKGVGKVFVMVTYEAGPEIVPAVDSKGSKSDTTEKDSDGGERTIAQNDSEDAIVYTENSGTKEPVILKQLTSKVMGVVVAADGGDNLTVKANIVKAVEALTGVSAYKIQVFKRN